MAAGTGPLKYGENLYPNRAVIGTTTVEQQSLDVAQGQRWRRFLPKWIRALLWTDFANRYDAFISYSLKADRQVAPVIQSVTEQFLCPWYRTRAKTVFRDLSCLPAGSSLEDELKLRLDRSEHLIVLASPNASQSRGMELEAEHWFSRERRGEVLIIVTDGVGTTWEEIRERLLPPPIRKHLVQEPLFILLQHRRPEIVAGNSEHRLRGELTEDLNQLLLRFYPGSNWSELRGAERSQRRRAIRLAASVLTMLLILTAGAATAAWLALREQAVAESRQFAAQSQQVGGYDPAAGLVLALRSASRAETLESEQALFAMLEAPMVRFILHHAGPVLGISYSRDGSRLVTGSEDKFARIWDTSSGTLLKTLNGHSGKILAVKFSPDSSRILTGSENGFFQMWTSAGDPLFHTDLSSEEVGDVVQADFSPDGRMFAVSFDNGWAGLWNTATGKQILLDDFCTDFSSGFSFSPDSSLIAVWGSGCVVATIFKTASGKQVSTLGHFDPKEAEEYQGHGRPRWVKQVVFNEDGHRALMVMSGSDPPCGTVQEPC